MCVVCFEIPLPPYKHWLYWLCIKSININKFGCSEPLRDVLEIQTKSLKNAYKEIHILVQIQPSCLQLYKNELLLIYFRQFYLHTKQFFKFELFVKILKQLFSRTHINSYFCNGRFDSYFYCTSWPRMACNNCITLPWILILECTWCT